ncbi:MAG: hypothetical protein KAX65_00410, partial [Caldilineaceae bacterium]|nr:hypothetical protein [Caldilineaceae bacterium]
MCSCHSPDGRIGEANPFSTAAIFGLECTLLTPHHCIHRGVNAGARRRQNQFVQSVGELDA